MLEASKDLVRALIETLGKKYSSGTHPVLQSFGKVVEKCDTLKALPKSNKRAATLSLKDELGLLKDALGELEEARSNGFMESFEEEEGFEEQWKEDDALILNPSLGLIKTAVAMHNVHFGYYVFLPTEQAETYLKRCVLINYSTYICLCLFGWKENMINEETVSSKL